MSMTHVGREVEFEALGRTWRLARWTRATWGLFLDWARTQLPDPTVKAEGQLLRWAIREQALQEELGLKMQQHMATAQAAQTQAGPMSGMPLSPGGGDAATQKLQQEIAALQKLQQMTVERSLALASDYCGVGTPRVNKLLGSAEGMIHLLWLLLHKHQSDVTEEDALQIMMDLGQDKVQGFFDTAAGTSGNAVAPQAA